MSCANLLNGSASVPVSELNVVSQWAGQTTLVAGTKTITVPFLPASAVILLSPISAAVGATNDALGVGAVANAGLVNASFTIYSSDAADVRDVKYVIVGTTA